jgi:hypothetical protein
VRKSTLPAAVLILGVALGAGGQAPPASSPPTPLPQGERGEKAPSPAVQALIEQLGDPDFRKRDEAARRLEAEGVSVVPALRRALGHADPEVRRRARELVPVIETAALLAPRRITLKMADKPLRTVFDEFTRQTGYKIEFWTSNANQTYTFDFAGLTFWEALDRVCAASGLVLQPNYGDERILLQQQDGQTPFVRHEGPFRFVPLSLQQTRTVQLGVIPRNTGVPQQTEALTLSFNVFAEPRMPLLGIGEIKLEAACDTEKNSMVPPAGDPFDPRFGMVRHVSHRYGNGNRSFQVQTQLELRRPSLKATGIKVIRGSLPLTLLVEQKPIVVADKVLSAKGKKVTVGTTTFFFEDVTEMPGKQYQLKLSVTEDNRDNPNDWTWMNTLYQRMELVDEGGKKFQTYGWSSNSTGPNNVQMTITYGQNGAAKMTPPAKFLFHSWKTLQHLVPFEFKDLPLP